MYVRTFLMMTACIADGLDVWITPRRGSVIIVTNEEALEEASVALCEDRGMRQVMRAEGKGCCLHITKARS